MKETKEASLKENKDQAKWKQFYAHTSASVDHHFFCMWRMFVPFFCKYVALLPSNPTHRKKRSSTHNFVRASVAQTGKKTTYYTKGQII